MEPIINARSDQKDEGQKTAVSKPVFDLVDGSLVVVLDDKTTKDDILAQAKAFYASKQKDRSFSNLDRQKLLQVICGSFGLPMELVSKADASVDQVIALAEDELSRSNDVSPEGFEQAEEQEENEERW